METNCEFLGKVLLKAVSDLIFTHMIIATFFFHLKLDFHIYYEILNVPTEYLNIS